MYLLKYFLCCVVINLFLVKNSFAEKSEANDLCNYLYNLAEKNSTSDVNQEMMQEINANALNIVQLQNQAIRANLKFEKFQEFYSQKTKSTLPETYKGSYLKAYVKHHCGKVSTEAGLAPEKSKNIYRSFTKEPDSDSHSYYKDYKNAVKAKN